PVTSPAKGAAFLVEAATILASLDYRAMLARLAGLMVPAVADWCAVDLLEEAGALDRIVSQGLPRYHQLAARLVGRYPPWADAPSGPFRVARTERPEMMMHEVDPCRLALSSDPEHLDALRELAPISAMCLPVKFRGETLGTMTFARTSEPFRPLHMALARTLSHRVGQAIAHGRMYEALQDANRRKD